MIDVAGKIQPQARELESAVLGAIMIEKEAFSMIEGIISSEDFYDPIHQVIFSSIENLSAKHAPIDIVTVMEELRKMGEIEAVGGPVYLSELTSNIGSSANIEYHAQIIKQKSIARKIISAASEIANMAFDETIDVDDTLGEFEKKCTEIVVHSTGKTTVSINEAINETLEKASETQALKENGKEVSITTGLRELDNAFMGGFRSPDLIIVGARPSMGKTQLALHFAKSAFNAGKHVLFITIEMTASQLVKRYLLEDNAISGYNLETGQMNQNEWEAIDKQAARFWDKNLTIDEKSLTISEIKSVTRKEKRKGKLDLLIIDYLGLVRTKSKFERRDLEVGFITKELKNLCKELNIPIILLCQLNRPIKGQSEELKASKAPDLEDLRESGEIEQHADKVCFIHRPSYYSADAQDSNGQSWHNRGKIIISKDRTGVRNEFVIFHHDERFKLISDSPIHPSSQFPTSKQPEDYHIPDRYDEMPF
jgi:replicative DNA helicase